MAVGAYRRSRSPPPFRSLASSSCSSSAGLVAAVVGLVFGIPSLRIKGFYLAVATLASQFFLIWLFDKVPWFTNYASSAPSPHRRGHVLGVMVTGPEAARRRAHTWSRWPSWPSSRSSPRISCGAAWAGRGSPSATVTSRRRSSASGPCARSSSPSRSAPSIAGWREPSWSSSISAAPRRLAFDIDISFSCCSSSSSAACGSILGSFLGAAFIVLVTIFLTNAPHLIGFGLPVGLLKQDRADRSSGLSSSLLPDRRTAWSGPTVAVSRRRSYACRPSRMDRQEDPAMTLREVSSSLSGAGPRIGPLAVPLSARPGTSPFELLVYRHRPYAPSGIPIANGFVGLLTLLNERDGGINRHEE